MSLVSKVGRRRPRARFALTLIYAALILGAVTTLYPFLLMVSTGFKSATDQDDNKVVPAFWSDSTALFDKYLDDKYHRDKDLIAATRLGGKADDAALDRYEAFLLDLPAAYWSAAFTPAPNQVTSRLQERYQNWLHDRYGTVDAVNHAYLEENTAWADMKLPAEQLARKAWKMPESPKYTDWAIFKSELGPEFRIPVLSTTIYQEWMRGKCRRQWDQVPPEVVGKATKFEELQLPTSGPIFEEFRKAALPDRYEAGTAEERYARFTGSVEPMPIDAWERRFAERHAGELKTEFSSRNFRYVLGYILLNGRALLNTAIYCFLAILTALIVNPLAAYALSRYPIRASGKILIFLLATMAFPAEVAMIPSFLLLRDLGLLNTFAALVLPGAASGYTIFLLKGFFDSLPQELFEAGALDGAKEMTMLRRIALPMSRPVLGYIALLTFMGAYSAFLYAFLVVQDQKMWTLTVWLYQLQQTAPKATIMAGLTLAAVPTLLVFLLAQRVIMRGIVLPGEK